MMPAREIRHDLQVHPASRSRHGRSGRHRGRSPDASASSSAGSAARWLAAASGRRRAVWRRLRRTSADHRSGVCHAPQGRQRVRRRRRRAARRRCRRARPLQPRRRGTGARLPTQRGQGDLGRRARLGAKGGHRRLVSVARQDAPRRGTRSGGRLRGAPRRADRSRQVGHAQLRRSGHPGHRLRRAGIPAARQHRQRASRTRSRSSTSGRRIRRPGTRPDGSHYKAGDTIRLPALAGTLKRMVEAERAAKAKGRSAGIGAARDRFYKGDIAREMVAFLAAHQAPFDLSDFSEYFARIEAPAQTTYRGYTVYKHGFGSQGPVLLQTLNILEQFDLKAMGYGSADYLHTVTEAMKLAYADRDTYYADPAFVTAPAQGLLSKEYAQERARLINRSRASRALVAGDPMKYDDQVKTWSYWRANIAETVDTAPASIRRSPTSRRRSGSIRPASARTRHTSPVVDKDGNVFDATPERRLDHGRRHSRRHRHRHECARRAVLPRHDARQPDPPARASALHVDAEPRLQGRRTVSGAWQSRAATTRSRRFSRRS